MGNADFTIRGTTTLSWAYGLNGGVKVVSCIDCDVPNRIGTGRVQRVADDKGINAARQTADPV